MTLQKKCNACEFFDCGDKCSCYCHHGVSDKIRQDHQPHDLKSMQKQYEKSREEESMEGLSSLFG